ncbi:MAG: hypothetical protein AB7I27_08120 [Bacteriovoracaceae bacterium]
MKKISIMILLLTFASNLLSSTTAGPNFMGPNFLRQGPNFMGPNFLRQRIVAQGLSSGIVIAETGAAAAATTTMILAATGVVTSFSTGYAIADTALKVFDKNGKIIGTVSDGMFYVSKKYHQFFN